VLVQSPEDEGEEPEEQEQEPEVVYVLPKKASRAKAYRDDPRIPPRELESLKQKIVFIKYKSGRRDDEGSYGHQLDSSSSLLRDYGVSSQYHGGGGSSSDYGSDFTF
jgi:hypothetical protein